MAVTDNHCNTATEFSDKKSGEDEGNSETLASPEQGSTKKKKRRNKKNDDESNQQPQVEVCPKPLLDTVIPIVPQEEKAETATQNPNPTPKKKKKKKDVQGAQQLQTCDPSISIGVGLDVTKEEGAQLGDANGNGALCPKPLVDTVIPIVPQEEKAETATQNPNPTPKKKKKKKDVQGAQQLQTCDPSISIGVGLDVTKEEGAQQGDANGNGGLCPKPLVDTVIPIVPQEEKAETATQNPNPTPKKKKKKKDVQGAQQLQTCDPSISIGVGLDVTKEEGAQQGDANGNGGLCPKPLLDTVIPIVPQEEKAETATQNPITTPKKKKKKKNVQGAQHLQTCDPSISFGVGPDVTKEEGAQQGDANGNGGLCPKSLLDTPVPIVPQEEKAEKTTQNPYPTPRKKKNVQGAQELQTCNPSISIGVEPNVKEEGAQQGAPVPDPTPLEDTPGKKKRKKKNVLKPQSQGSEPEPEPKESNNTENPQQCSLHPEPKNKMKKGTETNSKKSRVCPKPELAPPLDIAIPSDMELKKRAEPIEAKVEHLQACSKPELASPMDLPTPMNLEKKKEVESSEANAQHPQPQPGSKHEHAVPGINEQRQVPDSTPPEDTPRKKKRRMKSVLKPQGDEPEPEPEPVPEPKESNDTEHPQQCSPDSELKIKKKKGAEANAEHYQMCSELELSPPSDIAFPNDSEVKKGAEPTEAKVELPQACSKPKLASPINLPAPINPKKKKEAKLRENPEARTQHPQRCSEPSAEPSGDPTTPIDQSGRKRKGKRGREKVMCSDEKVENQRSPLQMDITLNQAPNQVQPEPAIPIYLQPASMSDQTILVDPAIPVDTEQKTKKKKRKKQRENVLEGEDPNNKHNTEQPEFPIQTSTCLIATPTKDPAIPMDPCPAIPIWPAISTDPEQEMSKKRRKKKRKSVLESEEAEPHEHSSKLPEAPPEAPVQKSVNPIAAPSIDPIIPIGPAPLVGTATPIDQGQEMTEKKRKKKRKSVLESEEAEPHEHNSKLPEAPPEAPVQKSVNPIAAPSIDPIIPISPAPLVGTAIPIDQGQEMTEKKRKKNRRSALISEGTEPNELDGKAPETPVQRSIYPIVPPSIDPTIPVPAPPINTATPIDQGQKTSKKKRKRSDLISKGAESNEHGGKPPGTPVQRSIYPIATPSVDATIPTGQAPPVDPAAPVDPATPVDPEQMTKKKKKKKKSALKSEGLESANHNADPTAETPVQKTEGPTTENSMIDTSALKSEGLESENHNADPTAETPVQKTKGPTTENSMGRCNDESAAKTPVQKTDSLRVTKSPFKQHGESSLRCRACRQLGHKFQECQRLKCLSMDEEVCFFCGEIGHSLGKCCVSQAGGGRFAKCLFCYEQGHFSYNCPRNGHGIDPKVVAANGAINRTAAEAKGVPLADV